MDLGAVGISSASAGLQPSMKMFEVTKKWTKITLALEQFGLERPDITGISFSAGRDAGTFELFIDDVRVD